MRLANLAVLAAASLGCSVYEPGASGPPSGPPDVNAITATDAVAPQASDASSASEATVDDHTSTVVVEEELPTMSDASPAQDARPPVDAADAAAVADAGCTFKPEARGDGSVVVLVAHWKFEEGAGTTAVDDTGHCYTGTLQGGAKWATGKIGKTGLDVDLPTTGSMDVPVPVLDTTKPYTATAWVFFRRVDGFQTVLGIDGKAEQAFQLQINNNRFSVTARPADDGALASIHVLSLAPPQANVWYHLGVVYDGATLTLYVNGSFQSSLAYPVSWLATGRTVVGRGKHNSTLVDFVTGTIDDVRLYQGVLTAQEIAALANP